MTIDVTVSGTIYPYLVDEQVITWEPDADVYGRLDKTTELDWRLQRATVTLSQVWQHPPGYNGPTKRPIALAQDIISAGGATLDMSVEGRSATVPVVLAADQIRALQTRKGSSQLRAELSLVSDWYDPDEASDRTTIDAINELLDVIG